MAVYVQFPYMQYFTHTNKHFYGMAHIFMHYV